MPRGGVAMLVEAGDRLSTKHLLSVEDLTDADVELILRVAESFSEVGTRSVKKVPALRGKTVATLFYESSTRTRISFELAAKRLSADMLNVTVSTSSVSKGEALKDTVRTLEAMGVDCIVLRHSSPGAALQLTKWTDAVIVNGGDGSHQHPSQALLDLFTLRRAFGGGGQAGATTGAGAGAGFGRDVVAGKKILVVGDIAYSRVARSTISLLSRAGADVVAVGPPTLIPPGVEALGCRYSYDLDEELPSADVIYLLRMQFERQKAELVPSLPEYARLYMIDAERLSRAKKDVVVMHPGPMNRGTEIGGEVADLPVSAVLDQVESGLAVRMSLLYLLLGGADAGNNP